MAGAAQDRGSLRGIALTLLTLALLAERAAARSFPVRFLVLAILGRAEAIARAYVVREIEDAGWCLDLSYLDEPLAMRFGAAEAELLALRLRMVAAVLDALTDAVDCLNDRSDIGSARLAPRSGVVNNLPLLLVVRLPAARRHLHPPDTS